MDITPLTDRLDELITGVRFDAEGGRVLVPERPIDLDPLVLPLYPDYDPKTWEVLWVGFYDDAGVSKALELNWADEAPISWDAEIDCLIYEERAYLFIPPDENIDQEWQAIAVIEPADHRGAWEGFVEDLLTSGGMAYGVEMFHWWPTDLWNQVPDLVDQACIDRARERWVASGGQV